MEFQDNEFDIVFDKGTLDAIFTDDKTISDVNTYFKECSRVLKFGGKFICVSLAQEHIIAEILQYFSDGFAIHIHCIEQKEKESDGLGSKLPVFVFVITKLVGNCKLISILYFILFFSKCLYLK